MSHVLQDVCAPSYPGQPALNLHTVLFARTLASPEDNRKTASPRSYICQLPLEVLIHILLYLIDPLRSLERCLASFERPSYICLYYPRLYALQSVSRHWLQVITSFPTFWTHLHMTFTPDAVRRVLDRSKGLPLSIAHDVQRDHTPVSEVALQSSPRWHRLYILLHSTMPNDHGLFREKCTSIQQFRVISNTGRSVGVRYSSGTTLFAGNQTAPTFIALRNVWLPIVTLDLSHLHSLSLTQSNFTLSEVFHVLRLAAPSLHRLRLQIDQDSVTVGALPGHDTLSFPRLTSLNIMLHASQVQPLLLPLHAPVLEDLTCMLWGGTETAARDVAEWSAPVAGNWKGNTLEIRLHQTRLDVIGPYTFTVCRPGDIGACFRAVMGKLPSSVRSSVTRLLWTRSSCVHETGMLRSLSKLCPDIHTVDLKTCDTGLSDALEAVPALMQLAHIHVWSGAAQQLSSLPEGWILNPPQQDAEGPPVIHIKLLAGDDGTQYAPIPPYVLLGHVVCTCTHQHLCRLFARPHDSLSAWTWLGISEFDW